MVHIITLVADFVLECTIQIENQYIFMKKNFISPDLNYLALKFSDPQLDPRLLDCLLQTFLSIFSCSLD